MTSIHDVVGAAVFDLNGLPKEYFTTADNDDMGWVQTIFQVLGLRSLLISSLQLENFRHATIQGTDYYAIVVKQRTYYTALLLQKKSDEIPSDIIGWAQSFEPSELRNDPRFKVV